MSTTMRATLRVEVAGSTTSSATHTLEAEAFERIEVAVAAGGDTEVAVHPAGAEVQLLQITASAYPLTATPAAGDPFDLDAPLMLVGRGAVGALGDVSAITFANAGAEDVDVTVIVGRDATP